MKKEGASFYSIGVVWEKLLFKVSYYFLYGSNINFQRKTQHRETFSFRKSFLFLVSSLLTISLQRGREEGGGGVGLEK